MASSNLNRRDFLSKALAVPVLASLVTAAEGQIAPKAGQHASSNQAMLENSAGLKTALIIGDAVHTAMAKQVQERLEGKARVIAPIVACGNSLDILRQVEIWIKKYDPDVVHISTGFEDVRTIYYGSYENMVPVAFYKRNVKTLIEFVFEYSAKAIPIWAMTMAVDDDHLLAEKSKTRDYTFFNEDILAYNRAAYKICKGLNVPVNDLYNIIEQIGPDKMLHKNGYDLSQEGEKVVANAIADRIEIYL